MVLQGEGKLGPQRLGEEERRGILREIADRLGDVGRGASVPCPARDEHPAGGWPVQTGDEPQQRRLARAVAPHQRDELARPHLQIDAAQHGVAVPPSTHALQCDDRCTTRGSRIGRRGAGTRPRAASRRWAARPP